MEWKPFVNNRVSEIRRRVHPDCWSHCPGALNPADLPSRGLTSLELSVSQLWRRGPEWMQTGSDPNSDSGVLAQGMPSECYAELKAIQQHNLVATESKGAIEAILDPTKFSTLSRLSDCTDSQSSQEVQRAEENPREYTFALFP